MRAAAIVAAAVIVLAMLARESEGRKVFAGQLPSSRCAAIGCKFESTNARPGFLNTTVNWFNQTVDHFSFRMPSGGETTYLQRYLTFDGFYKKGGPIFFYTGNEGNVELYANASGLIWENAEDFGALIVFGEHRYYGSSLPFGAAKAFDHMEYLTSEQALADYAVLIQHIKEQRKMEDAPVIAFGGSYGGMLSSWFRITYPGSVDGAIAASAPILAFSDMNPAQPATYWDSEAYWAVVTRDASAAGGATDACAKNVHRAWNVVFEAARTAAGLKRLGETFKLCAPLKDAEEAMQLAELVKYAFDTMAVGNFPFPSSYLTGGAAMLPAFPVRAACKALESSLEASVTDDDWKLVEALEAGAAVFTNVTATECLTLPADVEEDGIWDYQWCTEMQPQETYFATDGVNDMFWKKPFDAKFVQKHCFDKYGVTPRPNWIRAHYGGKDALAATSNIVFSNGLLDPWSSGGVRYNVSETVVAIEIALGAHHLDLMFSDPNDPPCVTEARKFEIEHVSRWVKEANERRAKTRRQH